MKLTLSLQGVDRLDNGQPARLVLDRHGVIIGRSPHADWSLPDPKAHISSRHCEIDYRDGAYILVDTSTNGTFVNGSEERVGAPYPLKADDVISIGPYRVKATLSGAGAIAPLPPAPTGGFGWKEEPASAAPSPAVSPPVLSPDAGWPAYTLSATAPSNGWPEAEKGWAQPRPVTDLGPVAPPSGGWADPLTGGGWPEPAAVLAPEPGGVATGDIWGAFSGSNMVDWARGGFDGSVGGSGSPTWGAATPTPALAPAPAQAPRAAPDAAAALTILLKAAGVDSDELQRPPEETLNLAGAALLRLVGGLVVMLEARARAKSQLGAQGTLLELEGNNPLKFARNPQRALIQLLGPKQQGYMGAERAVEDAFKDLQAHQMATLAAMQGALRSTLDRFSPAAIRGRAESRGLLAKIIPSAREAELWRAYEREFEGVVQGSDEAFMDVFARAFKAAYEKAAGR